MGRKALEDGFPAKAEDLFPFQGLIIGTVGGQLLHLHRSSS